MQNHSGLVNGCLLLVNLIQQGVVRAAPAHLPTGVGGAAKGHRLLFNNKMLQGDLKSQQGSRSEAAKQPRGGCLCACSPGGFAQHRRAARALTPPFGGPEGPTGTSFPFPMAGGILWAPAPGQDSPLPPRCAGAHQAKDAEPCHCIGVGKHHLRTGRRDGAHYAIPFL